jgi:hypothetical protein
MLKNVKVTMAATASQVEPVEPAGLAGLAETVSGFWTAWHLRTMPSFSWAETIVFLETTVTQEVLEELAETRIQIPSGKVPMGETGGQSLNSELWLTKGSGFDSIVGWVKRDVGFAHLIASQKFEIATKLANPTISAILLIPRIVKYTWQ